MAADHGERGAADGGGGGAPRAAAMSCRSVEAGAHFTARRLSEAAHLYAECTRADPENSANYYNLGMARRAAGRASNSRKRLKKALKSFQQVVRLVPTSANAYSEVGHTCLSLDDQAGAAEAYRAAASLEPTDATLHFNLANTEHKLPGRVAAARAGFRHAIRLDPTYHEAYYNLATTYLQEGRSPSIQPSGDASGHSIFDRSSLLASASAGDGSSWTPSWRADKDPLASSSIDDSGDGEDEDDGPCTAVPALRAAVKLRPTAARVLMMAGTLIGSCGELKESIRMLRACVALVPHDPHAYRSLGTLEPRGPLPSPSLRRL